MTDSSVPDSLPDQAALLQLGSLTSLFNPWAIRVAVTLRLPDLIADGARGRDELAAGSGSDPEAVGRLMRHLTLLGLYRETSPATWEATEVGQLLEERHPVGYHGMLDQENPYSRKAALAIPGWLHSVRSGGPAWKALFGRTFWDDLANDRALGREFHSRMANRAALFGPEVARGYDWSAVQHVVDVGGGTGRFLAEVLAVHPHLRGTLVDLPGTIAGAGPVLAGVADRCAVAAQSFFDALPTEGDVYFLASILQDWNDEDSARILSRCAAAAGPGGRVLLAEQVTSKQHDAETQAFTSEMDLLMLLWIGGKVRSEQEFRRLGSRVGLRLSAVLDLAGYPGFSLPGFSLIEYVVEG